VDADGLNTVARAPAALKKIAAPLVLTPHPGEMARLTGQTAREVQAARWEVARQFVADYPVTLVLKGAGTVVTDRAGKLWVNATGNPGMAKGGMGDALTGLIGALLALGMPALEAAKAGVFFHGQAGDVAADRRGQAGMLATDLIEALNL
jgi:NAD(P)H-hydrate epimerase